MWQKERLLNLGLQALPETCRKVAWLDCDIVFGSDDWVAEAERRLDDIALLQPFRQVRYVARDGIPDTFRSEDAEFVSDFHRATFRLGCAGCDLDDEPARPAESARSRPGMGGSARVLDRHGLYDACVIGGGDRAMVVAADGAPAVFAESRSMHDAFTQTLHGMGGILSTPRCGPRVASSTATSSTFGTASLRDRAYANRHESFSRFDFDPTSDIAMADNGTWRWNSDKAEMHAYVRNYLLSRKEDG